MLYRKTATIEVLETLPNGDVKVQNQNDSSDQWVIPKSTFESTYENIIELEHIELTDFGWAVKKLKEGYKVARSGWNGKSMFLFLVQGSQFKVNRAPLLGIYPEGTEIKYQPHIDMKTAQDTIVPWLASQSDILADDWEIIE
jgi:hypothetical protein